MAIENDKPVRMDDGVRSRGLSFRTLIIAALALLVVGIVGGGWAMSRLLTGKDVPPVAKVADVPATGTAPAAAPAGAAPDAGQGGQPALVVAPVDGANALTLEQLRAELDALAPELVGRSDGGGSFWTGLRREVSELFVVRPAGTQSLRASERLDRARRYLAGGQVDKAIEEVQAMPGAAEAKDWLIAARRYHEARRALDLIETAAILEPRDGPAAAMARKPGDPTS